MKTDNTLQKLLPCPFCNIHVVETARGYAVHHRAGCFMGAKGSTYFLPHEMAAWNTRAQPAPAAGVVERAHAAAVMALEFATHYRDGRNLMCVSETEFSDGLRRALLAALPAPSVGEDEAVKIMLNACTDEHAYGASCNLSEHDAQRIYRALIAAGVIRGV